MWWHPSHRHDEVKRRIEELAEEMGLEAPVTAHLESSSTYGAWLVSKPDDEIEVDIDIAPRMRLVEVKLVRDPKFEEGETDCYICDFIKTEMKGTYLLFVVDEDETAIEHLLLIPTRNGEEDMNRVRDFVRKRLGDGSGKKRKEIHV